MCALIMRHDSKIIDIVLVNYQIGHIMGFLKTLCIYELKGFWISQSNFVDIIINSIYTILYILHIN